MGLRLKKVRAELSLTQEVMARTLETGRANYTRIEVGDIFVVNKADRPGAQALYYELASVFEDYYACRLFVGAHRSILFQ
jgi:DNA-binding XRE family transcriptional regulator